MGAFTGDLAAEQLKDVGASFVIVGHSERRSEHGERSAYVQEQAHAALRAGLTPIVCVGETYAQRERGETKDTVVRILRKSVPTLGANDSLVVAYEPLWAIGTGLVPSAEEIADVHGVIRKPVGRTVSRSRRRDSDSLWGVDETRKCVRNSRD